ncbi:MAG: hypothetical protein ACYDHN_04815 [Solirubrobacteraceae bacterium]
MGRFRDPRLRIAGVVLLAIAGLGYLIGYDSAGSGGRPAVLTSAISNVASLGHPPSWQTSTLPRAYGALTSSMRRPVVLSPRGESSQAGLIVGMTKRSDSPLPRTLLTRVSGTPRAEVVLMVTAQAYRYRDLQMNTPHMRLTAFAVPIGVNQEALEICYSRSTVEKVKHECEQIAEGLAVQGEPVELTSYGHLVGVLRSIIPPLLAQRLAVRRQMHAAGSGPTQATLAARMAGAFGATASRLSSLPPLVTSEKALTHLTEALRAAQSAYAAYAHDVRTGQELDYLSALRTIDAAEARLRSALSNLALVGY